MSTLKRNEVTKTRSSKVASNRARTAPSRASSAATTAIGRYGWSSTGMFGLNSSPRMTPMTRPATATMRCPSGFGSSDAPSVAARAGGTSVTWLFLLSDVSEFRGGARGQLQVGGLGHRAADAVDGAEI